MDYLKGALDRISDEVSASSEEDSEADYVKGDEKSEGSDCLVGTIFKGASAAAAKARGKDSDYNTYYAIDCYCMTVCKEAAGEVVAIRSKQRVAATKEPFN